MKKYQTAAIRLLEFENEDVVRTSTPTASDENELPIKPFDFGAEDFDA